MTGPRRLIEVDLPIREISAQARREKSIRHGHISTLHIWWARRPLAACRSVVLAALVPDPGDPACPEHFRNAALAALRKFRDAAGGSPVAETPEGIRKGLLDFIARFSAWEASTDRAYLETARALVGAGYPDGPPLVVDPFAGGGAIPLEALRVGADAWACDYNPVAALLLKVVLEDIPRYGERLAEGVAKWGRWVKERVQEDIGRFYPPDPDGAVPIAYLWARTVACEGPGCGAEVPLLRQLWLARKRNKRVALNLVVDKRLKRVDFEVEENPSTVREGTVRRGSAVCPVCGYVTPVARVRAQAQELGGLPVRMVAVVRTYPGKQGRYYRVAKDRDLEFAGAAEKELRRREKTHTGTLSIVPNESVPLMSGVFNAPIYGLTDWSRYFLPRQALSLGGFISAVGQAFTNVSREQDDSGMARAMTTCLGLGIDRQADRLCSLCRWHVTGEKLEGLFSRQAIPMVWDFAEANPFSGATGDWEGAVGWIEEVCSHGAASELSPGQAYQGDARTIPLPDSSVPCVFTDPPYYNAVPYADLSDFFYVWLRRSIGALHPHLFGTHLSPKDGEIAEMAFWDEERYEHKNKAFFESEMENALADARRILQPGGVAVVVFAHKTTSGWEAMLNALLRAGWTVTGSWPLDTEMATRLRARDSAALASSVHIVCRPRTEGVVGNWREVRRELEGRVASWLPRLSDEGIEGADAIFACLGPALEVYSQHARVETAAGAPVPLSPPEDDPSAPAFLPAVWAAVAREALKLVFEGVEAEAFEEDARLSALWLWTLRAGANGSGKSDDEDEEEEAGRRPSGLVLDYDTARKLAQALGAHLETLGRPGGVVSIRGAEARLVPVRERGRFLLSDGAVRRSESSLFEVADEPGGPAPAMAQTTLDRVHQAMLLFADGRGAELQRLLEAEGDARFRRLARALNALYPVASEEKRWIEGVLQRVKD